MWAGNTPDDKEKLRVERGVPVVVYKLEPLLDAARRWEARGSVVRSLLEPRPVFFVNVKGLELCTLEHVNLRAVHEERTCYPNVVLPTKLSPDYTETRQTVG